METKVKEIETFYPASQKEWRKWLKANHDKKQSIWIICYKKDTGIPTVSWSDAVDEALCFGWIDSTRKSIGDGKFIQFFTHRKPKSSWSKINKEKVERLTEQGLMTKAGLDAVAIAKQNGAWEIQDVLMDMTIPKDLENEFHAHPGSKDFFQGLSNSVRKNMLHWVLMAKRPETRQKRITEIAELAARGQKPKQF